MERWYLILIVLGLSLVGFLSLFAFDEPTASPPSNAGRVLKVQSGQLVIDKPIKVFKSILSIMGGKLGVNLASPTALFHLKYSNTSTVPFQIENTNPNPYFFDPNLFPGWSYRRQVTIDNTQNTSTLTDYQILVILNTQQLIGQNKMRSDCGDIRFTDSDGSTQLSYWLASGCNTTS
ncbi:MAG: DUF2341 domain-containing protein, partial [Patescibacteria group bacterium]|nr:DUF2341 domain-containing protein [Patescibacteria group bacterium]